MALLFGPGILPRLLPRLRALFNFSATPEIWIERGKKKYQIGRLDEAINCFNEALEIDPENIDAWNNKVGPLMRLGRDKEASIAFSKVIALTAKKQGLLRNK